MMKKTCSLAICLLILLQCLYPAFAEQPAPHDGFTQLDRRWIASEDAYGTLYRHDASGLSLFHLENDAEGLSFSIGFVTPPRDDKGANHVLEHAVLCGNEKYPVHNLMHHLRNTSLAWAINAVTNDQTTAYLFQTANQADYYNLMDVYLNAVFYPLILNEENIFLQQGIRWEATADSVTPNGVVYNELRLSSLETSTSMLLDVVQTLNGALFEDSTPVHSSGGEVDALLTLTYQDVLDTYASYYHPDNAMVFVSGKQDMARTFALLDEVLSGLPAGTGQADPIYTLRDEALTIPAPEGDTDASTLVDIGFAFSGIPTSEPQTAYARDAMLMMAIEHLRAQWPDVYMVLDETSGYATFSVIVSGVPEAEAEGVISDVNAYLTEELGTLLTTEAMTGSLDNYEWMIEDGYGWALSSTLKGFASGDPYAMVEKMEDFAYLREHPEVIQDVWQQHIVDTPHQAIAMLRQQPNETATAPDLTDAELSQLREQTEAFHAWVDAPESAEALATLPTLKIADYTLKDLNHPYETGSSEGITYWLQPGDYSEGMMALAVSATQEHWLDLSLLARAFSYSEEEAGIAYFVAYDDPEQAGHVQPRFVLHPYEGEDAIQRLADMLINPEWLTEEKVSEILDAEIQAVGQYLGNAYSRTLEALYSDISPTNRFGGQTLGLIGSGTEAYLAYLREMAALPAETVTQTLQALATSLADRGDMMVYVRGDQDALDLMLDRVVAAFPMTEGVRQLSVKPAEEGTRSALVISPQGEATVHYLQAGVFDDTDYVRDGRMDIMARVLQNGYMLPELRDKRGAYGGQVLVDQGFITLGASGVRSIDETYEVLMGAGDYLRELEMTQAYLDSIIVSAVSMFDMDHGADGFYPMEADLSGTDVAWLIAHREEMLATTVEDVKAFADFIDEMVAQQRVFAYTNAQGAKSDFAFAETVMLTK